MIEELDRGSAAERHEAANAGRRNQVGSGERSDKRRTFRIQEGRVHDHISGLSAAADKVLAGHFNLLWRK
jgi:protein subunit release factor A